MSDLKTMAAAAAAAAQKGYLGSSLNEGPFLGPQKEYGTLIKRALNGTLI